MLFHALFEVLHQCTPNASSLRTDAHDQGMQFPHMAIVGAHPTNPTKDALVVSQRDPTDAIASERRSNFLYSRFYVWPGFWPVLGKTLYQQRRNLADRR